MRSILALLLLISLSDGAQARTVKPVHARPAAAPAQTADALPVATGEPHACPDYPPRARERKETGVTSLVFTVTTAGTVRDINVTASSGYGDLDDAAVACAAKWQYRPAMKGGAPVDVSTEATVQWSLGEAYPSMAAYYLDAWRCANTPTPDAIALLRVKGPTKLSVEFAGDAVSKVTVSLASGNDELDARAVKCFQNVSPAIVRKLAAAQSLEFPLFWNQQ
jgi:TonB family protein